MTLWVGTYSLQAEPLNVMDPITFTFGRENTKQVEIFYSSSWPDCNES